MNDLTTTIPCHIRTVRGLDQPKVFARGGVVYASSEDVAAYFGKQHSHVLRDIKRLVSNDKSCASNFGFTSRDVQMPSGGMRQTSVCNMNRDGFTLLAMGFTGKRALGWKLKYIEAFNAMEAAITQPRMVLDEEPKAGRSPRVDQMDASLDLLITAETALAAEGWLDPESIAAIRGTIGQAVKILAPVRSHLNGAHG